jgi:8-oxo-dGTP pyrophosphatase MutT (NUDIX family)
MAAIREAREELGLAIDPAELIHIGTLNEQWVLNDGTYLDNEIHGIFVMRREVDLDALTFNDEVMAAALVTPEDLTSYDLVPHPDEYALLRAIV